MACTWVEFTFKGDNTPRAQKRNRETKAFMGKLDCSDNVQ